MTPPRTYTASAPLDVLARALMDEGFRLCPRDDVAHEYARLGKPGRDRPTQVITILRTGAIEVSGSGQASASRMLGRLKEVCHAG